MMPTGQPPPSAPGSPSGSTSVLSEAPFSTPPPSSVSSVASSPARISSKLFSSSDICSTFRLVSAKEGKRRYFYISDTVWRSTKPFIQLSCFSFHHLTNINSLLMLCHLASTCLCSAIKFLPLNTAGGLHLNTDTNIIQNCILTQYILKFVRSLLPER